MDSAYIRGKRERKFDIGQLVYLREPLVPLGNARKFHRPWTGPHTVVARSSPWNYQISVNKGGLVVVHANRLKAAGEKGDGMNVNSETNRQEYSLLWEGNGSVSSEGEEELVDREKWGSDRLLQEVPQVPGSVSKRRWCR